MSDEIKVGQKVYLIKYALSRGVYETEVLAIWESSDSVALKSHGRFNSFSISDVATTLDEAVTKVRLAQEKRIKSLQNQIRKLEAAKKANIKIITDEISDR